MEPTMERMDPQAVLYQALTEAGADVVGSVDASLNPTDTPVTVVRTTSAEPAGRLTRWVFSVTATVVTYAATEDAAWTAHTAVSDAVLGLGDVIGGSIRVSGVVCTQEPTALGSADTPQWPGLVSLYSMTLRRNGA